MYPLFKPRKSLWFTQAHVSKTHLFLVLVPFTSTMTYIIAQIRQYRANQATLIERLGRLFQASKATCQLQKGKSQKDRSAMHVPPFDFSTWLTLDFLAAPALHGPLIMKERAAKFQVFPPINGPRRAIILHILGMYVLWADGMYVLWADPTLQSHQLRNSI